VSEVVELLTVTVSLMRVPEGTLAATAVTRHGEPLFRDGKVFDTLEDATRFAAKLMMAGAHKFAEYTADGIAAGHA
jgi:hypothetical protein